MTQSSKARPVAKWLIVALLGVIAACLLVEAGFATSAASAQSANGAAAGEVTTGQSGDIFAVAGKITSSTYGLYLVNTRSGTMTLYEWLPKSRKLRLKAARNYTFDLQLDDFNTEPSPREIKKLVEQSRRLNAGGE